MVTPISGLDTHVLVLNRVWVAIRVTDARKAFSLMMRDAAQAVRADDESYSSHDFESWTDLSLALSAPDQHSRAPGHDGYEWVRTVRSQIAVPRIIRLCRYDRLPKQDIKLSRRNIFARDSHRCQYCGDHYPHAQLSLDHVVPRSQGGPSSWENLVCCCRRCNAHKGGRTPAQARMKLVGRPIKPHRHPLIKDRFGHDRYACWQPFLKQSRWPIQFA